MKQDFQNWMKRKAGQYHLSFNFIDQSPALKGHHTKQKVINLMVGSDYAMNGQIRWTRQKYQQLADCSYTVVRDIFDYFICCGILIPIIDTSNYELDLAFLERRLAKDQPLPIKRLMKSCSENTSAVTQNTTSDTQNTTSDTQNTTSDTQYLHIDSIDLSNKERSLIGKDDDILSSSSSQPSEVDLEDFLRELNKMDI